MNADEMTLDELRIALAPRIPAHAAFDGWSTAALAAAAGELGVPADRARLAFSGGAVEMIDAWFDAVDRAMTAALPAEALAAMKIRARIRSLVWSRIDAMAPHREALRRALAILAQPRNLATASRLAWRAADRMWRLAGDEATDLAHYTKRMTLIAVYGSTTLVWLDDASEAFADTAAFLDRRIDEVIRFETMKMRWRGNADRRPSLARFVGRLRYPAV